MYGDDRVQMLLVVLNRTEKLNDLLDAFIEHDLSGATILKSIGMVKMLAKNIEHYPILGSLRRMMEEEDRKDSKTIFMVLHDDKIETAKTCVRQVLGDLSQPNTAILLTLPVLSVEGVGF